MGSVKHLHELLKEDQEPFRLKSYINDKRSQFKRPSNITPSPSSVQLKKRKETLTVSSSVSAKSICKHACFFSLNESPDVRKSPFPDFRSPVKSPCKGGDTVYLHVPARTAALLLEAAMRIQKQQSLKPKSQTKSMGFGMFSSLIKKLKDRSRSKECEEIRGVPEFEIPTSKSEEDAGCSCSGNNSLLSSAGWSESNEEKSLDMETCTSSCGSPDSDGIHFEEEDCGSCDNNCSSSPSNHFRFSLQKSPPWDGRRTPDSSSPAASTCRRSNEEKECQLVGAEEEDKEQSSPVSIFDPPFEDGEDDAIHEERKEEEKEDDYDEMECSLAFMQRAKEHLFLRLRRFEKLAELDPIELEQRMMEQLEEDDDDETEDQESKCESSGFSPLCRSFGSQDSFVNEVCTSSRTDMKRLVSDLITEEKREFRFLDSREIVVGRVCKKLDSWKDVESNTMDMMVELDFRSENEWWKFPEERDEAAIEIELAIFGELLDQLSEDLL